MLRHLSRFAVALILISSPAVAAELGRSTPKDQAFDVVVLTGDETAAALPLNRLTSIVIRLVPRGESAVLPAVESVVFDARMPGHGHGMVVKPKVEMTTLGEYRVEGVKLHMPGDWTLHVNGRAGGKPFEVTLPYKL